jgi:hypothetical protein
MGGDGGISSFGAGMRGPSGTMKAISGSPFSLSSRMRASCSSAKNDSAPGEAISSALASPARSKRPELTVSNEMATTIADALALVSRRCCGRCVKEAST